MVDVEVVVVVVDVEVAAVVVGVEVVVVNVDVEAVVVVVDVEVVVVVVDVVEEDVVVDGDGMNGSVAPTMQFMPSFRFVGTESPTFETDTVPMERSIESRSTSKTPSPLFAAE